MSKQPTRPSTPKPSHSNPLKKGQGGNKGITRPPSRPVTKPPKK